MIICEQESHCQAGFTYSIVIHDWTNLNISYLEALRQRKEMLLGGRKGVGKSLGGISFAWNGRFSSELQLN